MGPFLAPVIFAVLALSFAWLAWREKVRHFGTASAAYKTRVRVAVIFAIVSAVLFFLQA